MKSRFATVSLAALSTAATTLAATTLAATWAAQAADMPSMAYKAPPPAPAPSWAGLYFGIHGGGAHMSDSWFYPADPLNAVALAPVSAPMNVSSGGHSATGWLAGGQVGYNFQIKNWVLGVEGDFSWTNLKGQNRDPSYPTNNNLTQTDFIGTFGGRAGYAWDKFLAYGKLGLAWAHETFYDVAVSTISSGQPPSPPTVLSPGTYLGNDRANRFGLMVGAGGEYALTPNWSIRAEYEHLDFGKQRMTISPTAAGLSPFDEDIRQRADIFDVGLNYKLDPSGNLSSSTLYMAAPSTNPWSRLYGSAEYLLWSVKGAPLSVPLVTTGTVANKEGFLLNSSSTILYGAPFTPASGGNDTQNFPMLSGGRLTVGSWLDDAHRLAIEGSGFALAQGSAGFQASNDGTGTLGLRIPVFNNVTYLTGGNATPLVPGSTTIRPTEDGTPVAIPNQLAGSVVVSNTLQLWGADAAAVMPFYHVGGLDLSGLLGFSYLQLTEKFFMRANISGLAGGMYAGQTGYSQDEFDTANHFYGALLGLRGRYTWGKWSVETTERLALGVNHEVLTVSGYYMDQNAPFAATMGPYGTFAMPANEGTFTRNVFGVVPQGQVKLGYEIMPGVKVTVGYDFLYESNVIRPTDQINRDIPKGQTFQQDGTAPSTTSPARMFKNTDFYAQGLNVGMNIDF